MAFDHKDFEKKLETSVNNYNKKDSEALTNEFIATAVTEPGDISMTDVQTVLQILREKRFFVLMCKVGSVFFKAGKLTHKAQRLYGQALIETNNIVEATAILDTNLERDGISVFELRESAGLLGRINKQLYVNNPADENRRHYLETSLELYYNIYLENRELNFWHGINSSALLHRAEKDGVEISGYPTYKEIAKELMDLFKAKDMASMTTWEFGTAMEASLALGNIEEALSWLPHYVNAPKADTFELGSTLRQMIEVWQLNFEEEPGRSMLPQLQCEILKKENGSLVLNPTDINMQTEFGKTMQKVLGDDRYKTLYWYLDGLSRCSAVARIGLDPTSGKGTGFLLNGEKLHKNLSGQIVLLTNAHVISHQPELNENLSLNPKDVVVILEVVDRDLQLKVKNILWSSDMNDKDFSVLTFDEKSNKALEKIRDKICCYEICEKLPLPDGKNRFYIIGHPAGGTLQLSLQDNAFTGHKDPILRYRTPTAPGSSGSPIFNEKWQLVGIHHAGDEQMPGLLDPTKTEEANEGISMKSILDHISKTPMLTI